MKWLMQIAYVLLDKVLHINKDELEKQVNFD